MKPTARKQRAVTSKRIDQTKPAFIVIHEKFGGLTNFCRLTGYPTSTAHEWMVNGCFPARRGEQSVHAHILQVASDNKIRIRAADLIETPANDHDSPSNPPPVGGERAAASMPPEAAAQLQTDCA